MAIPASAIVTVNPAVVSGTGNPLALNGVILTQNQLMPSTGVKSFGSAADVGAFFGLTSTEYALSAVYFNGYDNSTLKPSVLYFAPYAPNARKARLIGANLSGVTLEQIKAFPAEILTVTIDGAEVQSAAVNLSNATSYTDAATIIQTAFADGNVECDWDAVNSRFDLLSSTSGATSAISYVSSPTTLAASLGFTQAVGAQLSQGVAADTPVSAMTNVVASTQNWVSFMTVWQPSIADMTEFADWLQTQNQRYLYAEWDNDPNAIIQGATSSFGAIVQAGRYDGVVCVYNTPGLAALVLGTVASIDFTRRNGRITTAFKSQSGFVPTVTSGTVATNLLANGYSFYGKYATANDSFNFLYNGQMAGKWKFIDPYVNQIYLTSEFQLKLMALLTTATSIPYTESGYSLIRAAMSGPIADALNSGIIRTGVILDASQRADVNSAAGKDVADLIERQGYYMQTLDPGATVRQQRGTPVINFWYTDGGSVQKITLSAIDIL